MIEITQQDGKWRIEIEDELLQFPTKKEFDDAVKTLTRLKGMYGNIFQIEEAEEKRRIKASKEKVIRRLKDEL